MRDFTNSKYKFTCPGAPVQAEGRIGKKWWYFRAGWKNWRFGVGDTLEEAIANHMYEGIYDPGNKGYAASWKPLKKVEELISQCLECYGTRNQDHDESDCL